MKYPNGYRGYSSIPIHLCYKLHALAHIATIPDLDNLVNGRLRTWEEFLNLTSQQLVAYMLQTRNQQANTSTPTAISSSLHSPSKKVDAFQKSIKRELSAYTTLKDDKYWDTFERNMMITAAMHHIQGSRS